MSSKEDYQTKISSIEAVSNDDMKSPNMPVELFLQEAENMYHWCQPDKEKLIGVGLDIGRRFTGSGGCASGVAIALVQCTIYP